MSYEITRYNAETAENFEHKALKNADKTPLRARRNGKTKMWKNSPHKFSIPCKYGLKKCFYITNENSGEWTGGN